MRHTPGPWHYDQQWIVGPDVTGVHPDIYIAEIVIADELGRCADHETQNANGQVLAAAPELLAACQLALQLIRDTWIEDHGNRAVGAAWEALAAAIAAAESQGEP
jgi:hypothetical protein